MEFFDYRILYLLAGVFVLIGVFVQASRFRKTVSQEEYDLFEGKKLKFASAEIDGQSYGSVIEFKLGNDFLGVKSYFPKFSMVVPYSDITLSKKKAFIGSMVKMNMPLFADGIVVSHRLAKKIDLYSDGKLGYKNITSRSS